MTFKFEKIILTEAAAFRGLLALALGLAGFLATAFGAVVFFVAATFLVPAGFCITVLASMNFIGLTFSHLCSTSSL